MKHAALALLIALSIALSSGCSTTRLTTVWKSPDAPAPLQFKKIVVACMTSNEVTRRAVEDQLVGRIGPALAAPSYQALKEDDLLDKARAKETLRSQGFDGAIIMRLVDVSQQQSWVPSSATYDSFSGYWGNGWSGAYSSGYMVTDTIVQVETVIYSIADDKMLWAARSESYNPYSAMTVVDEIADAAAKRLKKDGLIAPAKK